MEKEKDNKKEYNFGRFVERLPEHNLAFVDEGNGRLGVDVNSMSNGICVSKGYIIHFDVETHRKFESEMEYWTKELSMKRNRCMKALARSNPEYANWNTDEEVKKSAMRLIKSKSYIAIKDKQSIASQKYSEFKKSQSNRIANTIIDIAQYYNVKVIAFENIDFTSMQRFNGVMTKRVNWGQIREFTKNKWEEFSKKYNRSDNEPFVKIQAQYTSQRCSRCGSVSSDNIDKKDDRLFICMDCGLELHRDFNASLNIERSKEIFVKGEKNPYALANAEKKKEERERKAHEKAAEKERKAKEKAEERERKAQEKKLNKIKPSLCEYSEEYLKAMLSKESKLDKVPVSNDIGEQIDLF